MIDETQPALPLPNGPAAAAILAAGIGACSMGVFSVAGDVSKTLAQIFNIYNPAGPLAGVSSAAIILWLLAWVVLARLWRGRDVGIARVMIVAFILLAASLLLTFPPAAELF